MKSLFVSSLLCVFFFFFASAGHGTAQEEESAHSSSIQITLAPKDIKTDDYYCTYVDLPSEEQYIIGYEPHINADIAHHMLLFGCEDQGKQDKIWSCKMSTVCSGYGKETILYAWAKAAPGFNYPKGVGFKVGGTTKVKRIVMQVHFHASPKTETDTPHLVFKLTTQTQPNIAGIFLLGGAAESLKPGKKNIPVNIACKFHGPNDIHPIGFRTHAHSLSPLIIGYVISKDDVHWKLIGEHSPQEPQAFYPTSNVVIHKGDILAIQCYYDTSHKNTYVFFGPDSDNEMCNFYIMYYTKNNGRSLSTDSCWDDAPHSMVYPDASRFLTAASHQTHTHHHHHDNEDHSTPSSKGRRGVVLASDWPMNFLKTPQQVDSYLGQHLGQVAGVSVDTHGNVYMFHRGNRKWDFNSFDYNDVYINRANGPISNPTLIITSSNGTVIGTWGTELFYLPHGLTVDTNNVVWMTDVARHQIFKLPSLNRSSPLTLGEAFVPGTKKYRYCKPTSFAVDVKRNRLYVADGYCNQRVLVYSYVGHYITEFSSEINGLRLNVPHSLALSSDGSKLYVADRENYRIVVYDTSTGIGSLFVPPGALHSAVYAISFSNGRGDWPMYAINGSEDNDASGFTIDKNGHIIDTWTPGNKGFSQPHDIAVSADGKALYVAQIGPNKVWKFNVLNSFVSQVIPSSTTDKSTTTATTAVTDGTTDSTTDGTTDGTTSSSSTVQFSTTKRIQLPTSSSLAIQPSTTSCVSTLPSDLSNLEAPPTCPRPPPPVVTSLGGYVDFNDFDHDDSDHNDLSYSSAVKYSAFIFITLLIIIIIIFSLVTCLILFVRYQKRTSGRPIFNVRRFYSRDPNKKMNGLLKNGRKGFTKVNTYDSETDEEITVFQIEKT